MSTPTVGQLQEENRLLAAELNRVEDLLAASRAERDELGSKYSAMSNKLEQSLRGEGGETFEALVQQNIELRRKFEEEHASYRRKLQDYHDEQQRQAQLVQKLQAKLQSTEKSHKKNLEVSENRNMDLESTLIKLEEEKQRSVSLAHVNAMLREQLDQATSANQSLTSDIHKLAQDWQLAREELDAKEREWREEEQSFSEYFSSEHGRLLTLWRQVVAFRRSFGNLKTATENDFVHLRNEITHTSKSLLSAFLNLGVNLKNSSTQDELGLEPKERAAHENEPKEENSAIGELQPRRDASGHELNAKIKKEFMRSPFMTQEVLKCDRCNICPVQKYCNNCDTSLCDGCVVDHISSDNTKSHSIVTYELKNEDPKFPDCKTHTKEHCKMFCKECENPTCVKCITSGFHQGHHFIDVLEICTSEKGHIFQDTKELETTIYPTIENIISDLETHLANLPKNHEELQTSISQQGAEWHRQIDIIIAKRKEEIKNIKTRYQSTLQKSLADMRNLLSAILQTILDNKQLLKSNKFWEMKRYKSKVPEFKNSPTKFDVTPPTFTPNPIQNEQLDEMFGILKSSSVSPRGCIETTLAASSSLE